MISRFKDSLRWMFALAMLLGFLLAGGSAHAGDVEIQNAQIETTEDGYRIAANFAFDLTRGLDDALNRGIPLYFTTDVELKRPRWYWFDEQTVSTSRTVRLSYNVLTRQYNASVVGSLQQSFPSLEDALSLVRRSRWLIAEKGSLKPDATYNVRIRMRLDVAQLPMAIAIEKFNRSDWRLSSEWKTFSFKPE